MTQQSLWHWSQSGSEGGDGEGAVDAEAHERLSRTGVLDCSALSELASLRSEGARELHAALEQYVGPVDVTVTDNRRRMVSVSPSKGGGRPEVRLHHMFLGANDEVIEAVADLVQGQGDRARPVLQSYIEENRDAINFEPSPSELEQRGEHFDLDAIFERAGEHLIDVVGGLEERSESFSLERIEITWGRRGRGAKSIRFGSFDFDQRLIRVHPALDREWVPRFFVVYIVYHEMLHAVFPPVSEAEPEESDKRRVHTAEFKRAEREFPKYEEARRWERRNLDRFLDRDDSTSYSRRHER